MEDEADSKRTNTMCANEMDQLQAFVCRLLSLKRGRCVHTRAADHLTFSHLGHAPGAQACTELDRQAEALAASAAASSEDLAAVRAALQDMTRVNAEKEQSLRCLPACDLAPGRLRCLPDPGAGRPLPQIRHCTPGRCSNCIYCWRLVDKSRCTSTFRSAQ